MIKTLLICDDCGEENDLALDLNKVYHESDLKSMLEQLNYVVDNNEHFCADCSWQVKEEGTYGV